MKFSTLKKYVLVWIMVLSTGGAAMACNLSDLTLVSITGTGPYAIVMRLCVGMGLTGATKGGDQSTKDISFGIFENTPGLVINSFLPANLCGPMGCCMPGSIVSPQPGQSARLLYSDPGYYGIAPCATSPYGCVNSTALCGAAQAFCRNITINVNIRPDSIRAYGAEGGGNPIGGCYPNADMRIIFPPLPVVWGDFQGSATNAGVKLKWSTLEEINADVYVVERAINDVDYEIIAEVPATGNTTEISRYEYLDRNPNPGVNRYRLVQVDMSGLSGESEIIEVVYDTPSQLAWSQVGPNPTRDYVDLSFYSPKAAALTLQLMDVTGKMVLNQAVEANLGGNMLRLDLRALNKGNYYLSLMSGSDRIVYKIARL